MRTRRKVEVRDGSITVRQAVSRTSLRDDGLPDREARAEGLYGVRITRCIRGRTIEIDEVGVARYVTDFATNSPFGLNVCPEVIRGAIDAVTRYGAVHSSIAAARAQTGLTGAIADRLSAMKGPGAAARVYPTTLSANDAAAAGFARMDATAIVHTNVHATVQKAVNSAFDKSRVIRTGNTAEVARAYASGTRRPIVLVEDGLYSMGSFADFGAIRELLTDRPNVWAWLDDAHSVGIRGRAGRGEAMEQLTDVATQTVVTASFGKALGAAGGFLVGPADYVEEMLSVSVSDRFSCNLDIAAQGATLAALDLLAVPQRLRELQGTLDERLRALDDAMAAAGVVTEQSGTPIAFRVIPFPGAAKAIAVASRLLRAGFLTTPVYYPTIAHGKGAIRVSISAAHSPTEISNFLAALLPELARPGQAD